MIFANSSLIVKDRGLLFFVSGKLTKSSCPCSTTCWVCMLTSSSPRQAPEIPKIRTTCKLNQNEISFRNIFKSIKFFFNEVRLAV